MDAAYPSQHVHDARTEGCMLVQVATLLGGRVPVYLRRDTGTVSPVFTNWYQPTVSHYAISGRKPPDYIIHHAYTVGGKALKREALAARMAPVNLT